MSSAILSYSRHQPFPGSEKMALVNLLFLAEEGWPFLSASITETVELVHKISGPSHENNFRRNSWPPITGLAHVDWFTQACTTPISIFALPQSTDDFEICLPGTGVPVHGLPFSIALALKIYFFKGPVSFVSSTGSRVLVTQGFLVSDQNTLIS